MKPGLYYTIQVLKLSPALKSLRRKVQRTPSESRLSAIITIPG